MIQVSFKDKNNDDKIRLEKALLMSQITFEQNSYSIYINETQVVKGVRSQKNLDIYKHLFGLLFKYEIKPETVSCHPEKESSN